MRKSFDDTINWIYSAECGNGIFSIAHEVGNTKNIVFFFLDKHGIANIFRSMDQFLLYAKREDCERICVNESEYPEESRDEGVDFTDAWLYEHIYKIDETFKGVGKF